MQEKPISAWFCPDILVAEETKKQILQRNLKVELITAKTPIKERLVILEKHEKGEIEAYYYSDNWQKVTARTELKRKTFTLKY